MCDVMVATTIVEILEAKIQNQDVFTAFDITQEARASLGRGNNVPHYDVRNIVANEFNIGQMQDYNREVHTLNLSDSPLALVYFPDGKLASDHHLVDDSPVCDGSTDGDDDDDVITMTAEGRIDIPQKLLNQVDAPGGSYDFSVGGIIYPKAPDKQGRVRFSLQSLGISGGKARVTVDTVHNKIDIESV